MRSIKSRLIFYILLTTIVPILAFLGYISLFVNSGFRETEMSSNDTKITWGDQYLEGLAEQLEDIVYSIHLEENILSRVDNSGNTSESIEDVVKSTLYNNSNILSKVTIVSTNTYRGVSFDYENGFDTSIYDIDDLFIDSVDSSFGLKFTYDGTDGIALHTINNFNSGELEGIILLKLSKDSLDELESIFGVDANYVLYTETDELYNPDDFEIDILRNNFVEEENQVQVLEDSFVWTKRIHTRDLYISYIVPSGDIEAFSRNMLGVGIIIILISFGISIVISILFTNDITSPVISLANHMTSNELVEYKEKKHKYKEIIELENAHNQMIVEINDLITEKYKNEIERQSMQLRALQAQINPHFLSNTFQLIGGMALENGVEDIYEATIKMSKLVRYSMRIDQKAVSLEEELGHINGYLDIQKLRFGDRLDYTVDIKDEIKTYMIPKFTIQPIIENSFKYGLKKVNRQWKIKIHSLINHDDILIMIEDNGIGMKDESIDALNAIFLSDEMSINNDKDSKSVGLANINSRIKLLYGIKYGLRVKNNEDKGIVVIIKLPKNGVKQ